MVQNTVALLLENEPIIAMDLELALKDEGFTVTFIMSCQEAADWLKDHSPDVAIVDIMLRDGPCHLIVETLSARGVPFLVHSGDPASMHEGTAFVKGTWLSKPVSAIKLALAARGVLPAFASAKFPHSGRS
jgi:DNA-binding response OmpR family regulator